MAKIVTLGEIMLRLSPEGNDRFIQSESLRIIPGGGEANVAVSLANYGPFLLGLGSMIQEASSRGCLEDRSEVQFGFESV